ncbi:MAG: DUF4011 domain-containing protein [Kiritimatiellae bacterium]|nr:DUF4011 domain-containing protein [Kiritimatiellia bacterium]
MAESRVERWKRKLLDMSLRNPLLNARDSAKFLPMQDGAAWGDAEAWTGVAPYLQVENEEDLPFTASLPEKDVKRRLKELYRVSRSACSESGVNSLFLAVGFLNWNEKPGGDMHRAPLVLVPARLVRQNAATGYKLQRTEEDAVVNFCIPEMMRQQFGMSVGGVAGDGFGDGDPDAKAVFDVFAAAVRERAGWSVTTGVALGMFAFSKVVLWKDLTDHLEEFKRQPFVAHLVGGAGIFDDRVRVFPAEEVEKHVHPDRLHCPMSADSSQLAAVIYSALGKSFVLHGPPGTGKSQTITNIIAHNLALGRRVLFVSEKKAALDVVYRRLASCGLAPFCLELHSNKADKANVMRQFSEALAVTAGRNPAHWAGTCAGVAAAIDELGAYVRDLHAPCANGMSAYDCLQRRADKHPQAEASLVSFDTASASQEVLDGLRGAVKTAADAWKGLDRADFEALKPVRGCEWSPEFEAKVSRQVDAFLAALSESGAFRRFCKTLWQKILAAAQRTVDFPLFPASVEEARTGMMNLRQHLGGLRTVLAYRANRLGALRGGCRGLVEALEAGRFPGEDAARVFEDSCAEKTLITLMSRSRALSGFSGAMRDERIASYRELDGAYTESVRKYVVATLSKRLYAIEHPPAQKTADGKRLEGRIDPETKRQLGLLKRECEKKKRFMPPRRLLAEAGPLAMRLKPCFLMSPLSVAQYLPVGGEPFDLVVFDEASQMTVWDAVGVIARGRQLICVGDPKQLPPTSFFMKGDGRDDDDEGTATEDLESVLDECLANGLHSAYLNWHYRSRHESLIAFSNRFYYGDRLNTFPAAVKSDRLGVSFRFVEGGVFDHSSHTNRAEAEAIADYIFERLEDPAERRRSWGVVTFSVAQQRLIADIVERRSEGVPWAAEFFDDSADDPFFVKNLENVQGDERDVIIFSMTYAPDDKGRFAMSFGPVNRTGGERRLNVAVTRAREQVILFSSVRSGDIHADRVNSDGVKHLKALLEYAETGHLEGDAEKRAAKPEVIVKLICECLDRHGLRYDLDVGRTSLPVDVAVLDSSGRYVLGIECDGPRYASQLTVRDRDVLRPQVLQNFGWKMHRAWSVDWVFDRRHAEERLLAALGCSPAAGA